MKNEDINIRDLIEAETGLKFNTNDKLCCPFHKEKTPSFSYDKNRNKVHCYGSCNKDFDAIDFVMEYRNLSYLEACKYLNLDLPKGFKKIEDDRNKVLCYIDWQLKKHEDKQNWVLDTLYDFVDEKNKVIYFKAKFITPTGKQPRYYRIDKNGKVKNSLKDEKGNKVIQELPYNFFNLLNGIKNYKRIFIVEGEKDVDTLTRKGFIATSLKNFKGELNFFNNAKVCLCGDTGQAGEAYINNIKKQIEHKVSELYIVTLPYLACLGDNKDITDWFEAGHTKQEFINLTKRLLNLKDVYELQQDFLGIKKYKLETDNEGNIIDSDKIYITNFSILKAKSIRYADRETEGIELTFKNQQNEIITRVGDVTRFDDVKSFRNFLGTMALTFDGKLNDLIRLKKWIYKYFIFEIDTIYDGIQFKDDMLITPMGAISKNSIKNNILCHSNNDFVLGDSLLNKNEVYELAINLISFQQYEVCCAILGTLVNNLAYIQAKSIGVKHHHLLIVGESGSGKSTIKRNVINPILGFPIDYEGNAMDKITDFALTKALSEGNYTSIFDEYKPMSMNEYRLNMISSTLRSAYDNGNISRGKKDLKVNNFKLSCPVIICGEENYHNNEKALIERSLVVYISRKERTLEEVEAMEFLKNNHLLLNKLGNTLVNYILTLSSEEYESIRKLYYNTKFKDRVKETYINVCTGIHIFNNAIKMIGASSVFFNFTSSIDNLISKNVINEGKENNSLYEEMLLQLDSLIADNRIFDIDCVTRCINKEVLLRVSVMIEYLSKHRKDFGLSYPLLSVKDFLIQAEKGGYIMNKSKVFTIDGRNIRYSVLNYQKLKELGCENLTVESFKRL